MTPASRLETPCGARPGRQAFRRAAGCSARRRRRVRAVDGVSFELRRGETLGLVENRGGKTTLARTIVGLEEPSAGEAIFDGADILLARSGAAENQAAHPDRLPGPLRRLQPAAHRRRDHRRPGASYPGVVPRAEEPKRIGDLLEQVGLRREYAHRYPHEFSGGQRQRIGIARSMALDPDLIVCDEPVSALDVSVQAQVINQLVDIQRQRGVAYLFVAHDLAVVRQISHQVAVMYLGKIVEVGTTADIFTRAAHPYTRALLSAVPVPDPEGREARTRIILKGDPPSPIRPPSGCRFRTRCWKAQEICAREEPPLVVREGLAHRCACHFPEIDGGPGGTASAGTVGTAAAG